MKKAYYLLFSIMLLGHGLDYLTTFYVFEKGYSHWELNDWVKSVDDLIVVKQMGVLHAVALFGCYFLIEDMFPKKLKKFGKILFLVAYLIPTFILWKAIIINIHNCFLIASL
jgi:hypothetical protein